MREVIVKHQVGYKKEEGVIIPTYETDRVTEFFSRRYHNCIDKIILLNYMEIYLLLWLAERAGDECLVRTDKIVREEFILFISRITNKEGREHLVYKDGAVKFSFQALRKYGFLIPFPDGTRGACWMNPLYFYRNGSEVKRINMIKLIAKAEQDFNEKQIELQNIINE